MVEFIKNKIHELIQWTPTRQKKIEEWERQKAVMALRKEPEKKKPDLRVVKKDGQ